MLSIVVPARDEADSLPALAVRIRLALDGLGSYELVIVDDGSVDATAEVATELGRDHPVVVVTRTGVPGKGYALADGFSRCRADIVCMIDADLQYPPEAIPAMVAMVASNEADVVVANRVFQRTSLLRRGLSRCSRLVIGLLHRLDVDVQSGLKVIRRSVLDHVTLHPAGWAIDLELLVRARAAGFVIGTWDIVFADRQHGRTKIRLGRASWQVLRNAIALKLAGPKPAPG
ncbi:MAG TPA: glycosyltransferase family 2 protein [Pseudonocardiaceae bacterium]|jgi:dolichol-phosphate mannosyltransferase|nr:glycosyltransferase family 2 protein [Pseudonocardiaceae bacterium]